MRRKIRIVLDTNIIISAMFWSGFPSALFKKCIREEAELIISEEIIEEVKEVLRKERKFEMTEEEILKLENLLLKVGKRVIPRKKLAVVKDAKDNMVIECGVAGNVDFIVSGDKHLLNLGKYKGIRVITARKMVEIIEATL